MDPLSTVTLETAKDLAAVRAITYALSGIIIWDYFSTLRFDIDFVRGRIHRTWPLLVYFAARYSSLLFIGGVVPQAGSMSRVDCEAVWIVLLVATTSQVSTHYDV